MQIVHVVRQFHPAVGGLEDVVKNLASAQRVSGHSVRVVTLNKLFHSSRSRLSRNETIDGIDVVRVPFIGSARYPIAPAAIRHIRDADIVHVHGIDFFFDYLAWTAPLHRRRLVVSTHGGFFHTPFAARSKHVYFQTITRLSLTRYSGVATVSVSDDDMFRPIRKHGMRLIENGVDISKYFNSGSATPKKRILAIGRLAGNKRLDRAIRFVAALRRIDPDWSLCIAGRPWDVSIDDLRGHAERLGVGDAVAIVKSPSDQAIRALMTDCSILLSASEYEGFGLTLVEGMSAGLWPLASDIAPFRHLIEASGTGMTLDFDDPQAAARRFLAAWPDVAAAYDAMRSTAMRAAQAYQWPEVSARYEALYRSALGRDVRTILDVPILVKTSSEAVDLLDRAFDRGTAAVVAFANAHTLNMTAANPAIRSIFDHSIVFNDGIGIDIASRLLFGKTFPENLNGTDFVPLYLRNTRHRYRIFLVGGKPDVANRVADVLAKTLPRHEIVGFSHGYLAKADIPDLLERMRSAQADILLVAMGNPAQETWLHEHLAASGCRLGFGVGGLFDFLAASVPRAPQWVRAARLEWAFRMMQEPARLWRRYLVGMPIFLARVLRQWVIGARVSRATPS